MFWLYLKPAYVIASPTIHVATFHVNQLHHALPFSPERGTHWLSALFVVYSCPLCDPFLFIHIPLLLSFTIYWHGEGWSPTGWWLSLPRTEKWDRRAIKKQRFYAGQETTLICCACIAEREGGGGHCKLRCFPWSRVTFFTHKHFDGWFELGAVW